MSVFQRLQNSAFTDWFLGSSSIWAYPTVLTLHTVGMAILVGASFVINLRVLQVSGLHPLRGPAAALPVHLDWLRDQPRQRPDPVSHGSGRSVVDPVFYVKMASIAVALALGGVVKRRAIDRVDAPQVATVQTRSWRPRPSACGRRIVAGRLMAY
jgi:hypothetical protein